MVLCADPRSEWYAISCSVWAAILALAADTEIVLSNTPAPVSGSAARLANKRVNPSSTESGVRPALEGARPLRKTAFTAPHLLL